MGEFENQLAGALRSSEHVKETLLEEMRKSPEYQEWIEGVIAEERKRVEGAKPGIFEARYWKRSRIVGPVIGIGGTLLVVTGLSLADIIDVRALTHSALGTDKRVSALVKGPSDVSTEISQIIDDRVVSVIASPSGAAEIQKLKAAIREAVMERPFLVFQGWKPLILVPDESEFTEECQQQLRQLRGDRLIASADLSEAENQLEFAGDDTQKVDALNLKSQANLELERLFKEEAELLRACRDELDDPEVSFSFYADFDRDTVKVLLRVLKYTEGAGLTAVNKIESGAFSASLTSVSLNNPGGPSVAVDVNLSFVQDGILQATIARKDAEAVFNKSDPIYHLIVTLDRKQLSNGGEGIGFVVGSVVRLN